MKAVAHCFAKGARIQPLPINFKYRDYEVTIKADKSEADDDGLLLQVLREVDPTSLIPPPKDEIDEQGLFIEKRMRPYKEILTEVAHLIEGVLSISYIATPPKFDTDRIVVNIHPENAEEERMIRDGEVSGGFGNVFSQSPKPSYSWTSAVAANIPKAEGHIPALSFLTQAMRSQDRNDQEVAFFLYFRIIEGYFSDGASDVERALLRGANELSKYIRYTQKTIDASSAVLSSLQLRSKAQVNFAGLLKDLVLIRHKMTHFSKTNAVRHHQPGLKYDLNILNQELRGACIFILRDMTK